MCIDHVDHIANGRKPMYAYPSTSEYTELHRCATWLNVWNWLASQDVENFNDAEVEGEFQRHCGKFSKDEIRSCSAKCHIVDWCNYFYHMQNDGEIVIFGEA